MPSAKKAYVSDGVNWLPLVSGLPDIAGLATVAYVDDQLVGITKSSNPPASPEEGQLWFDLDTNELFMYDSVYWIEISGAPIDLTPYLTMSSASTIYLTQASASTTYLTQASGLTQSSASTIYLTQSSASTTYATQASLNNININGESDQLILPSQVFG